MSSVLVVVEFAVAAALLPAARRRGGLGRPWALLAVTVLLIGVGRVLTMAADDGGVGLAAEAGGPGAVGLDDVVYLVSGWILVAALIAFWARQQHRINRRDVLDAGLVTVCLALAVLTQVMRPMLALADSWPERVMAVAVPVQSLVVLSLTVVVVGHRHYDRWQAALMVSVVLLAVAGVAASSDGDLPWPLRLFAPTAYGLWLMLAYLPRAAPLITAGPRGDDGPPVVRRIAVLALVAFGLNTILLLGQEGAAVIGTALAVLGLVVVRCLWLTGRVRSAYESQLTEAQDERLLARVALRLVEAESPSAVHRTAVDGALSVLDGLAPVAVALAVGETDSLEVVVMAGDVALAGAVDLDAVLTENAPTLGRGPVLTRCGRGLLVPVVGRTGPLGVLAVLAPGADLDTRTPALESVARQAAVALEAVAGAVRAESPGLSTVPTPFVLAMQGPLPAPHSVTDLHRGMRNGEIRAVFQPIVRLSDRATVGYEALARWEHPTRGTVEPARFLRTAIDSGLVVPLGRQLLTQVVVTAARLPLGVRDLTVAVNLCATELRAPGLLDVLRTLLVANDVAPGRLVVEVTENSVLTDVDLVSGVLADLRTLGIKVHLDDFGTGYSSLSWLRQLPLDGIKIDRSFVADIAPSDGGSTAPVVEAITRMAQVLDLTVVAEGVETEAQAERLTALGCGLAQGWALGRPAPLDHDTVQRVGLGAGSSPLVSLRQPVVD